MRDVGQQVLPAAVIGFEGADLLGKPSRHLVHARGHPSELIVTPKGNAVIELSSAERLGPLRQHGQGTCEPTAQPDAGSDGEHEPHAQVHEEPVVTPEGRPPRWAATPASPPGRGRWESASFRFSRPHPGLAAEAVAADIG